LIVVVKAKQKGLIDVGQAGEVDEGQLPMNQAEEVQIS
jgi:hypothetical protein